LEYGRSSEKVWVYGGLRIGDGQAVTLTAPSRSSAGYQQPQGRVLAEPARGMVAAVSPCGLGGADFRLPRRDQPGDPGRDLPAQRPRSPVGMGPPATITTPPTTRPHLPNLGNEALSGLPDVLHVTLGQPG
jgi:hypothetical protein